MTADPPGFGDPAAIDAVAAAAGQAAQTLIELAGQIDTDIRTLTGIWSGLAAEAWQRRTEEIAQEIGRFGDPVAAYQARIAEAAQTMRMARQMLERARAYEQSNHLLITIDLRVLPLDEDPMRRAQAAVCQRMVDAAKQLAQHSRRQIATANKIADERLAGNLDTFRTILEALLDRPSARPGIRPGRTGGKRPPAHPEKPAARLARERLDPLRDRIDTLNRPELMDRWHAIDPADPDALRKTQVLRRDIEIAEDLAERTPHRLDGELPERPTPGGPIPKNFDMGNFVHKYADDLGPLIAPDMTAIPPEYAALAANKRIISIENLPPGLPAEVRLGDTARVDRLSGGGMIYEIKPATPEGIAAGLERLQEYEKLATDQKFGGSGIWSGTLVLYDPVKAMEYVKDPLIK